MQNHAKPGAKLCFQRAQLHRLPFRCIRYLRQWSKKWMHETPYAHSSDWVFPSFKLKGRQPRIANMLVSD